MNRKERVIIAFILLAIVAMVGLDLITDSGEGARWWHLLIEGLMASAAATGAFLLLKGTFSLRKSLEAERKSFDEFKHEAQKWRSESRKYLDGLSKAIDQQLTDWGLSASEKEVAFLLLKGLSLKEVAEVRQTSEKTARAQSIAIYSKSGLEGRSQLAAFFLEDLLVPSNQ